MGHLHRKRNAAMPQEIRSAARLIDADNIAGEADIPIGQSRFIIGRHPVNDLVISENTISSRHAAIELRQGQYVIIDQGSTNKTRLNGTELEPRKPYKLNDGDEIRFDDYPFRFALEAVPVPPPAPTPAPQAEASDETVFFDSQAVVVDGPPAPSEQAAAENDETLFFDSASLLDAEMASEADAAPPNDAVNGTAVRQEPAPTEESVKIGDYTVSTLLGRGGFGSVWKGVSPEGVPVAVKVLNPEVIDNERAVRKFFHEAIILSKMDHPNICRFIDFFPHEGNYAIVMDFIQGVELKSMLAEREGPLPLDQSRQIAAQALDAFHYAHMKDILHRDIKPENISVDEEGTAKVMDFGIAKLSTSESQQTSLFMVSPRYTAPERFDAGNTDAVDHRSDIYSLGLVFYQMFTGMHPFQTDNPTEMIVAQMNTVPDPPDAIAQVPGQISDAIMRAVEKNPADRFDDFGAFKMALFNEPPRLSGDGALELSGQYCQVGTKLFKDLAGAVKRYQKTATSFKVVQEGKEITVIIKTHGGNSIRIAKNLDSL
jgi:hypothetical protein